VPSDYPEPVAKDWTDLLEIVESRVKLMRQIQGSLVNPDRWWMFARSAVDLYRAVAPLERVLVTSLVQNKLTFAFLVGAEKAGLKRQVGVPMRKNAPKYNT
jgi:hypothetical protein